MQEISKLLQLDEQEEIIKIIRHYFIIIVPNLIIAFVVLLLDCFLIFYFLAKGWWGILIFGAIIFIIAFYFVRLIFLWKRNFIVVTSQQVIDHECSGFFSHVISAFNYQEVKNVTIQIKGFWQRILKYGDLKLEINNKAVPFELYNIKNPAQILEIINQNLVQNKISDECDQLTKQLLSDYEKLPLQYQQQVKDAINREKEQ